MDILLNARVERILFDPFNPRRVIGVRLWAGNSPAPRDVFAAKEVILSAGAIGSPHLLLVSGIGPARHLAEHGVSDGTNLISHHTKEDIRNDSCVYRTLGCVSPILGFIYPQFAQPRVDLLPISA